ncbi:MAG: cyclase family protein [Acidobacteria bacterium]|nr:cyclase family protein [Acidobacteriota bacterium]
MIRDITRPLGTGFPSWPGDPPVEITRIASMSAGGACDVSRLSFGAHAGTHVDAPSHVRPGGGAIDSVALDSLIGDARVIHLPGDAPIGWDAISRHLEGAGPGALHGGRLLIRTGSAETVPYLPPSFASLTPEAARRLVERGVRLVGIDTPSVDAPGAAGLPVHRVFAEADVAVLEWLDLRAIAPGRYHLVALPLRLTGVEASPIRAILIDPPPAG